MNELIKIDHYNGKRIIDARELHAFLENKSTFPNWIRRRIKKYNLVEGKGYWVYDSIVKNPKGGRTQ